MPEIVCHWERHPLRLTWCGLSHAIGSLSYTTCTYNVTCPLCRTSWSYIAARSRELARAAMYDRVVTDSRRHWNPWDWVLYEYATDADEMLSVARDFSDDARFRRPFCDRLTRPASRRTP
jgi:hypothetical protein